MPSPRLSPSSLLLRASPRPGAARAVAGVAFVAAVLLLGGCDGATGAAMLATRAQAAAGAAADVDAAQARCRDLAAALPPAREVADGAADAAGLPVPPTVVDRVGDVVEHLAQQACDMPDDLARGLPGARADAARALAGLAR